ncbi:hypothetical protein GGI25_000774 [Coemansia spiralis]|uniref:FAD-binding FR-type domain-containing protein n=2 Tax=Coemansia TaxID=4863 RepID=A0A9W8GCC8_9FUNG|nr:hypothetical protein EDC05_005858 [Coemansia umbellata]KAJ2621936.1 hypothetical protein GGI26_003640 [Coemansia sp. RSA 1358]KAJ2680482.1 hypothetical protein GGI25_000774 [Coemansia spiralis]
MSSFDAKYASGGSPTKGANDGNVQTVTRRASLLTRNRAFDGYKISDRRHASKRGGVFSTAFQPPEITLRRVLFISLWVAAQTVILVYKWVTGAKQGTTVSGFAKASTTCLMFSFSVIFIFMSPALLELLRRTFISRYVSIEKNVHAHKVAAYTALFWMIAHVISYYYLFHLTAAKSHGKITFKDKLFGSTLGKTGHALIFLFFVMFVSCIPYIRRRFFEVFYWMHHLFVPIVVVIFIHGSAHSFQWYLVGPGGVYVLDRLYRFIRSRTKRPRILSVIQHPSSVIEIKMERRGMNFQCGQYIYLNVPSISLLEWHPFTLTSAPEEDELSVHIWVGGGWTRKLVSLMQDSAVQTLDSDSLRLHGKSGDGHSMYADAKHSEDNKSGLTDQLGSARSNVPHDPSNTGTLRALADQELLMHHLRGEIDPASGLPKPGVVSQYNNAGQRMRSGSGTYRPWSRVGRNSTVLLDRLPPEIEAGLSGAYANVDHTKRVAESQPLINLPTIMIDGPYGAPTQQVFDYEHVVLIAGGIGVTPMSSVLKSLYYQLTSTPHKCRIRKIYFMWVCRDIGALEWFQDLLVALDEEDISDILEIRTYLTGQLSVEQIRNIALYQDPNGPDAVTGLHRSPTYYGRPNFNNIFEDIGMRMPGTDVGVFFCGPKPMGRTLRKLSRKWTKNFKYNNTKFVFHKENF